MDKVLYMGSWFKVDDEERAAYALIERQRGELERANPQKYIVDLVKEFGIEVCLTQYGWDYDSKNSTLCPMGECLADNSEEGLRVIAPYVRPGSFVRLYVESGDMVELRFDFIEGRVTLNSFVLPDDLRWQVDVSLHK